MHLKRFSSCGKDLAKGPCNWTETLQWIVCGKSAAYYSSSVHEILRNLIHTVQKKIARYPDGNWHAVWILNPQHARFVADFPNGEVKIHKESLLLRILLWRPCRSTAKSSSINFLFLPHFFILFTFSTLKFHKSKNSQFSADLPMWI